MHGHDSIVDTSCPRHTEDSRYPIHTGEGSSAKIGCLACRDCGRLKRVTDTSRHSDSQAEIRFSVEPMENVDPWEASGLEIDGRRLDFLLKIGAGI